MENNINRLLDEVRRLGTRLDNLERTLGNIDRQIQDLVRETGTNNGQILSNLINELLAASRRQEALLNNTVRESATARRILETSDNNMNEIRQALGAIYRNTDELEDTVIPGQRRTT